MANLFSIVIPHEVMRPPFAYIMMLHIMMFATEVMRHVQIMYGVKPLCL